MAPAVSSCELTALLMDRAAGARCACHTEYPRPIRATPVGNANSLSYCGKTPVAMVATLPQARRTAAHRARTLARKSAMPKMKPPAT